VAAAAAVERLAAAVERVEAYSAGLAAELTEVVSTVAPLRSPHDNVYPSGTCSICPRAIFITVAEEPDILAELLIHECGHDKLYLLQAEDPLLDPNVPGNGWDDARYYSPWKDAPRSLQGILHAAFVFTEVAGFWQWRLEHTAGEGTRRMAARRLKTLCEQLRLAGETLATFGSFTPVGQEVMGELRSRLDALTDAAWTIDGDSTEVMHVLYASAPYCGLSINDAIRRHHADHGSKALS
jgi:HEXXH motif-containing protein